MSNLSHPMIRRSERGPRAEADGGKDSSNESSAQPQAEMESNLTSSDATTESQDTDSSDELTEPVAAASSPSVSVSPGVRMGVSGNAIPVPEVEPEDPAEANISMGERTYVYNMSMICLIFLQASVSTVNYIMALCLTMRDVTPYYSPLQ